MYKIAEPDSFLMVQSGKYYVFPNHMVFRLEDGIYAVPHEKKDGKNAVDTFEENFSHLKLEWDPINKFKLEEIKEINRTIEFKCR